MTAASSGSGAASRGRGAVWVVAVVLGALLIAVLIRPSPSSEGALDPNSTRPRGTKAAMELARSFGAEVDQPKAFPPARADVALLLVDVVPSEREADVRAWVAAGHTLVVADPTSSLTPRAQPAGSSPPVGGPPGGSVVDRGRCDIDAMANVTAVLAGGPSFRYEVPEGSARCFADGDGAFAVLTPVGAGQIVSLGSPEPFTNQSLGTADDAVLVANLLSPRPGTRVAVIQAATFPGADPEPTNLLESLDRLLTAGPSLVLVELVVAFFVFGIAKGRRLGRPVPETQPVAIAGSGLVEAVGGLLERSKDPGRSAALLRNELHRDLCERLGLPRDADAGLVADTLAARTGFDRAIAVAVLQDAPVDDDAAFLLFARQLESLREEVFHEHVR